MDKKNGEPQRQNGGRKTLFDPNFHPQDYLEKKSIGWSDARIMHKWGIVWDTFYEWSTKRFPVEHKKGLIAIEAWIDALEYEQAVKPNPNQSHQVFARMRRILVRQRKPGFSKADLKGKAEIIDKLYEDGLFDEDQYLKAMDGLSKHILKIIDDENFKEEVRKLLKERGK